MKADKLSTLQRLIRGEKPISFDNRQTRLTKAANSSDKIQVDFHMNSDRLPKRVNDYIRKDFLEQEKYKRQRIDDERFKKDVEDMQAAKRLKVWQDSYRR